jgi:hypothetical protein
MIPMKIMMKTAMGRPVGSVTINNTELNTRLLSGDFTRRCTTGVGTANISLANVNNEWSGKWSCGEVMRVTMDFEQGTTEVFEGYVTKITEKFDGFPRLDIEAADYGIEAARVVVFKKYTTATDIGQVVVDLITDYLPTHSTTGITNPLGVTAMPEWSGKTLWNCLSELAMIYGNSNYDFFCDSDKVWHFFQKGTRIHDKNSGVAMIYGQNHISTNVNYDLAARRNQITVIGKVKDGAQIMATKKDTADIAKYWLMSEVIRDTNISTQTEAENLATATLAVKMNVGRSGQVTSMGLPNALPGYKMFVFDPNNRMNDYYICTEIKHTIVNRGAYTTTATVHEAMPRFGRQADMLRATVQADQKIIDVENQHNMENSYAFTFDDDTNLIHNGTRTDKSQLLLTDPNSTGACMTSVKLADRNITQCVVILNGKDLRTSEVQVTNNGITYVQVEPDTLHTFTTVGKRLGLKWILRTSAMDINPTLDSSYALYK